MARLAESVASLVTGLRHIITAMTTKCDFIRRGRTGPQKRTQVESPADEVELHKDISSDEAISHPDAGEVQRNLRPNKGQEVQLRRSSCSCLPSLFASAERDVSTDACCFAYSIDLLAVCKLMSIVPC